MTSKKKVLGVLFDGMLYFDFNGPQTAMVLAKEYPHIYMCSCMIILIWSSPADNTSYYDIETIALKGRKNLIVTSERVQIVADYTFQV